MTHTDLLHAISHHIDCIATISVVNFVILMYLVTRSK